MSKCPKCGFKRNQGDLECPKCGIVYKKFNPPIYANKKTGTTFSGIKIRFKTALFILSVVFLLFLLTLSKISEMVPEFKAETINSARISERKSLIKSIKGYKEDINDNDSYMTRFLRNASYPESIALETIEHNKKQSALYEKIRIAEKNLNRIPPLIDITSVKMTPLTGKQKLSKILFYFGSFCLAAYFIFSYILLLKIYKEGKDSKKK